MLKRNTEALSEILGLDTATQSTEGGDLFSSKTFNAPKYHETLRTKQSDSLPLPNVVVPANGDVEDFFATLATYYQDRSPLSALVHVLNGETADLLTRRIKGSDFQKNVPQKTFRIASVGAMLGEATLSRLGLPDGAEVTYAGCRRTLAFSLARATLLHGHTLPPHLVADRWMRLRKIARLRVSDRAVEAVLLIHGLVSGVDATLDSSGITRPLYEALQVLIEGDLGNDEMLSAALIELYPAIRVHLDDLRGAFDGRLKAFMRIVDAIQTQSHGVRSDEIAVAFFCNRILPGSFSHAGLLAKMMEVFPSAVIWYGFLSALSPASNSKRVDPGLITKLERDLLEPFSFEQRPRCDISLEELEVLSRTSMRPDLLRPSQQRSLLVSLLPGIDVYMRFGGEDNVVVERVRREAEADELNARASRLIEEALYTLKKARAVSHSDDRINKLPPKRR